MWTTNGTQADWMCLLANTSEGPPHKNKSLICLPMNLPGRVSRFVRWQKTFSAEIHYLWFISKFTIAPFFGKHTDCLILRPKQLIILYCMLTFFLFPVCSTVGVHIARKIDKLGMWSSDTAEVFFDDVHVPCKNVIGQEGMGFTYQMLQFQEERLWAVANSKSTLLSEAYLTYYSKDMMSSKVYFHPSFPHISLLRILLEVCTVDALFQFHT